MFVVHGEDSACTAFTECLKIEYGQRAYAPYSGTEFDLISNKFTYEAAPVAVKKKTKPVTGVFERLLASARRLLALVTKSEGVMTNKDMESKIISYVKEWTQVDDIENIIVGSFHWPADDSYSIFAKVDGKWYEGYKWEGYTKMPLTDEEYVEIGTFTSNCWNEYYNSDFYKKEMEEY